MFLGGLYYEVCEIGKFLKEKGVKVMTIYYGGGIFISIIVEEMDMLYEEMYEVFLDVKNVCEVIVEVGCLDIIMLVKLEVLNKWNIDCISINL